jgi:hypothetical protein
MGGILQDDFSFDIHILDDFEIPKNWDVYRCFDWGKNLLPLTVMLSVKQL